MKKIGVVGFGFMGVTHALGIVRTDQLELKAIVTASPENLQNRLAQVPALEVDRDMLNHVNVYQTLEECLDKEPLDALDICSHTLHHYDLTKRALEQGKHVLLEKPFCLDLAQGAELIDLARQQNVVLMIAHSLRFVPAYQRLKEWTDRGEYGKLEFLYLSRYSGVPAWGCWKDDAAVRGSCGGALFDLLIHDIDYMRYVLGEPAEIESAILPGFLSKHDYISARWTFKDSSTLGIVEGGNIFHSKLPFHSKLLARFERASVEYCSTNQEKILVANDEKLAEIPTEEMTVCYLKELAYFADCIHANRWPEQGDPKTALRAIELCNRHIPGSSSLI